MVKPMPMRLQVEEVAFGKVFRMLSGMPGVVSIDIDAESPKRQYNKKNGAEQAPRADRGSKAGGNSSICLMLAALTKGPVDRKTLEDAVVAGGKAKATLNNQLWSAKERKLIVKKANGTFSMTAKGKTYLAESCEVE
jgi:hypothetical protein